LERLGLNGSASVRYSKNYKAKYIIGIDFVRGLEWRLTEDSWETQWLAAPTQGASDLATV
jgi:hypothetical protein